MAVFARKNSMLGPWVASRGHERSHFRGEGPTVRARSGPPGGRYQRRGEAAAMDDSIAAFAPERQWRTPPKATAGRSSRNPGPGHDRLPPLLPKSDNGSAFKSEDSATCWPGTGSPGSFLRPVRGGIIGIGSGWTSDCLEAARRQANEVTRPQGHLGPTPVEPCSNSAC